VPIPFNVTALHVVTSLRRANFGCNSGTSKALFCSRYPRGTHTTARVCSANQIPPGDGQVPCPTPSQPAPRPAASGFSALLGEGGQTNHEFWSAKAGGSGTTSRQDCRQVKTEKTADRAKGKKSDPKYRTFHLEAWVVIELRNRPEEKSMTKNYNIRTIHLVRLGPLLCLALGRVTSDRIKCEAGIEIASQARCSYTSTRNTVLLATLACTGERSTQLHGVIMQNKTCLFVS
jgi:hypothetical protein